MDHAACATRAAGPHTCNSLIQTSRDLSYKVLPARWLLAVAPNGTPKHAVQGIHRNRCLVPSRVRLTSTCVLPLHLCSQGGHGWPQLTYGAADPEQRQGDSARTPDCRGTGTHDLVSSTANAWQLPPTNNQLRRTCCLHVVTFVCCRARSCPARVAPAANRYLALCAVGEM
jgi:hypothetical protein